MLYHKMNKIFLLMASILIAVTLIGCSSAGVNKNKDVSSTISQSKNSNPSTKTEVEYTNYLKKNTSSLDIEDNNNFSTFKLLEEDTKDKDIFLLGEYHYVKDNSKIQFKLLKYFKEKTNFKYLLWETSYLAAMKYNKFLETGDKEVIAPYLSTLEEVEFWKNLYEFNKGLKSEDKIIVVGPDVGNMLTDVLFLLETLSSKDLPTELQTHESLLKEYKDHIEKIYSMDDSKADTAYMNSFKETKEKFMSAYKIIKDNMNSYKTILKDDTFAFEYVLDNIKNLLDIHEQSFNQYMESGDFAYILQIRDVKIADNFNKLYQNLPKGKYFGKYGSTHAYQKEIFSENNVKTMNFAAEITKEGSPLRGKVVTIASFYDNCFESNSGMSRPITSYKSNKSMDSFISSNSTLIKLNGKNSPFSKELKWDFIQEPYGRADGGVTTDYFQYLLIIKNSYSDTWLDSK